MPAPECVWRVGGENVAFCEVVPNARELEFVVLISWCSDFFSSPRQIASIQSFHGQNLACVSHASEWRNVDLIHHWITSCVVQVGLDHSRTMEVAFYGTLQGFEVLKQRGHHLSGQLP